MLDPKEDRQQIEEFFWTDSKLENCRFESQRMSCLEHFDQTLEKFFKANGSITSDNI